MLFRKRRALRRGAGSHFTVCSRAIEQEVGALTTGGDGLGGAISGVLQPRIEERAQGRQIWKKRWEVQ